MKGYPQAGRPRTLALREKKKITTSLLTSVLASVTITPRPVVKVKERSQSTSIPA